MVTSWRHQEQGASIFIRQPVHLPNTKNPLDQVKVAKGKHLLDNHYIIAAPSGKLRSALHLSQHELYIIAVRPPAHPRAIAYKAWGFIVKP